MMARCDLCDALIEGRPWILLNRYGVGNDRGHVLVEGLNEDGDYDWSPKGENGTDSDIATGAILCWPTCVLTWIEGKMIASEVETRKEL